MENLIELFRRDLRNKDIRPTKFEIIETNHLELEIGENKH